MISSWGGKARRKGREMMVKPIRRILHSGLFGPWDRPGHPIAADELPPAINPSRQPTLGQDLSGLPEPC